MSIPATHNLTSQLYKSAFFLTDTLLGYVLLSGIECAKQLMEDILKRWSNSDEIRSLVYQYQELEDLAEKIRDENNGIDEETLSWGTCRDCPRLRSRQGDGIRTCEFHQQFGSPVVVISKTRCN